MNVEDEADIKGQSKRSWVLAFGILLALLLYVQSYIVSRDVAYMGLGGGRGSVKVIRLNYGWTTENTHMYATCRRLHLPCMCVDRWLNPGVHVGTIL